jgi:hypothetical protein
MRVLGYLFDYFPMVQVQFEFGREFLGNRFPSTAWLAGDRDDRPRSSFFPSITRMPFYDPQIDKLSKEFIGLHGVSYLHVPTASIIGENRLLFS